MTNKDVVSALEEIVMLLDLSGESVFKGRAYTSVARRIEQMDGDIAALAKEGRLREIKGVGDALEQKIQELVCTGKLEYLEKLRAKFPDTLFDLFRIPGLGAKRVKQLYEEKQIDSLDALKESCESGGLAELKGFGPKMIEKVLKGIEFAGRHAGQFHFERAYEEAVRLLALIQEDSATIRAEISGSIRRRKEVVKDLDIVASSDAPAALMKRFVEDAEVESVTGHGETKSSVLLKSGIGADLRVVSDEQYAFALAHFTGSKDHNVVMRQRAKERGLKLNEYGLFENETLQVCADESAIFEKLGLPFLPPELREDLGEFDVESVPRLVELRDIVGMIHCHSTYSDGHHSIRQMVEAAKERGYAYITITDHSQSAAYAGGLQPQRVISQQEEIDQLNEAIDGIRIIKGIESDIRSDGSLDYDEAILKTFEVVIASVHNKLDMSEEEATARVVKAVENPYTTILGHPTGRLLLSREGFPLDYDKVFDACVANRVAVEINANCRRLDLDWRYVRKARDRGVMLSIGPDAHRIDGLDFMKYGVGIARKGWLEPGDVLNCLGVDDFLNWRK